METLEILGINATVMTDITPNGNHTNKIKVYINSGDAIDRVQFASDYKYSNADDNMQLKDGIYTNGHDYIAYSMYPRSKNSIFLITARCSDYQLDYNASLVQISKAMDKAVEFMLKNVD